MVLCQNNNASLGHKSANSITAICCRFTKARRHSPRIDVSPRSLCWSQVPTPSTRRHLRRRRRNLWSTQSRRLSCIDHTIRRRCALCQWPLLLFIIKPLIIRLHYNMADFIHKCAEFVCWAIPMLYETNSECRWIYVFCVSQAAFWSRRLYVNVSVVNSTT